MMFSATYCSYCTVAKKSFGELGTQFQTYEVNKEGEEGQMMMDVGGRDGEQDSAPDLHMR